MRWNKGQSRSGSEVWAEHKGSVWLSQLKWTVTTNLQDSQMPLWAGQLHNQIEKCFCVWCVLLYVVCMAYVSVCVSVWYAWVRVCPPRCRVCKAVYGAANPDKKQGLSMLAVLEMQLLTFRSSLCQVLPASPCSHTTGPRAVLGLGEVTRTQDLAESDWTHCLDSQGHMLFGTYHWSKQSSLHEMTSYVGMWISIPPSREADGLSSRRHTLSSFKLCFTGDFADHLSSCSSCPMSLIKNLMIQSLLLYMVKSSLSSFQIWIIYSQMWPRPWHVLKALQVMLILKKGRNHRSRKHFRLEQNIQFMSEWKWLPPT